MSDSLREFVAAGPWPQRLGLELLLSLALRPRGLALLGKLPLLHQAATSLLAMGGYDEPAQARALGWDAEAVVAHCRGPARRATGTEPAAPPPRRAATLTTPGRPTPRSSKRR